MDAQVPILIMDLKTAALLNREALNRPKPQPPAYVVGWKDGRHVVQVGNKTLLAKSMQVAAVAKGQRVDLVGDTFFDH